MKIKKIMVGILVSITIMGAVPCCFNLINNPSVTVNDALMIQQYLAKIIGAL
ncbi:MAG: hypothetical protein K2G63_01050 [Oscillospiraceae bacterium]|nr:hypothetical protein [Oscillospiraceae bacterium]